MKLELPLDSGQIRWTTYKASGLTILERRFAEVSSVRSFSIWCFFFKNQSHKKSFIQLWPPADQEPWVLTWLSVKNSQILDGRTLELLQVLEVAGTAGGTVYRPDLREELRLVAESPLSGKTCDKEAPTPPCRLLGYTEVVRIDPEEGIVHLADGSHVEADLIIAADGVHSSAMSVILGEPSPALRSSSTAARAVIPVAKLQQNPFARVMAAVPGRSTFSVAPDGKRYLLGYWCHDFEYLNLVLYALEDIPGMVIHTMRGETTREHLAAALNEFHPDLGTVCEHLLEVLPLWRLYTRAPAPRYSRGRLVAIGDAAHAMLSVRHVYS